MTNEIINRRAFLRGIAAATPAAVLPLSLASAATPNSEDPELLRLGAVIATTERTWQEANAARKASRAVCDELCPPIPEALIVNKWTTPSPLNWLGEYELDCEGEPVYLPTRTLPSGSLDPDSGGRRYILSAARLRDATGEYRPRTKPGKLVRDRLAVAEVYESAREHARAVSGIAGAVEAAYFATRDLEQAVMGTRDVGARTVVGLQIKARAITALASVAGKDIIAPAVLGPSLAKDVARVFGKAA